MAANKFATFLHRKTHRMAFLLIYTVLEWILIIFLLLNAIFSYMIRKFASFFGLNPPCILCSRIDHIFEGKKGRSSFRDFLCESHAGEVPKLGFCSNHRRLADAGDMCEDCSGSKPRESDRSFSLLSWMKRSELGEKDLRCSCCGIALESGFYSPYLLLKTQSLDVLECAQEEKTGKDECFEGKDECFEGKDECFEGKGECFEGKEQKLEDGEKGEDSKGLNFDPPSLRFAVEDASMEILPFRVEKMNDLERIIPIQLIDSSTFVMFSPHEEESMEVPNAEIEELENVTVNERHSYLLVPTEEPCDDFSAEDKNVEVLPPVEEFEEQQGAVSEEDGKGADESNCEISIGSEICDQEQIEHPQCHEIVSLPEEIDHQHLNGLAETIPKESVIEIEQSEQSYRRGKHLKISPILNEVEDDRMMPETPTTPNYIDSFPLLQKRVMLDRRESGTESLDGSIAGDADNLEPPTIDRLMTALKSERKNLIALYAELEEERSASAIAANQTMAMITRLQEEKAAMQMEALHYQRMMEEQSEYDQEAVQLLNELMVKREKENKDLEKKLDECQKKLRFYENMEKKGAKECGSATSSSAEECDDDLSIESFVGEESYQNTHKNDFLGSMKEDQGAAVKQLSHFEEERLSIFEQIKALEEKLFEDVNHLPMENGHGINGDCELSRNDSNGGSLNGRIYSERKSASGKKLLPLFEVISLEKDDDDGNYKKLAIVDEIDQVYERLQALEADREFLKHCFSSLKKGDRGLNLLQEILQHLRDLRTMELNSRHN